MRIWGTAKLLEEAAPGLRREAVEGPVHKVDVSVVGTGVSGAWLCAEPGVFGFSWMGRPDNPHLGCVHLLDGPKLSKAV